MSINKITKYVQPTAALAKSSPIPPLETTKSAFSILVEAHTQYKCLVEQETTKREAISAWRDINVRRLEDQREILEMYLTQTFGERAHNINEMFERLDTAMEEGDINKIGLFLGGIVDLAKQSPLAGINQLISQYHDDSIDKIMI